MYKNTKKHAKIVKNALFKKHIVYRVCGLSKTKKLSYIHTLPRLKYKYVPRNFHSASLKSLLTSSTIVLSLLREKPLYAKILRHSFFRGAPGLFILIVLSLFLFLLNHFKTIGENSSVKISDFSVFAP